MQLSAPTAQAFLFLWAVVNTETLHWSMYREQARVKSLALEVTSMSYCSPQGLGTIKEERGEVCKTDGKEHFTSVLDTTGDCTHELTACVAA